MSSRSLISLLTAVAVVLTFAATAAAKTIVGTGRADVVRGTNGADVLFGRGGNDRLLGRGGNDRLYGGTGNDRLEAGAGRDVVRCGPGRDVAVVDARDVVSGCETVRRPVVGPPVLRTGPLASGTYIAPLEPRARFTVGAGWRVVGVPGRTGVTLTRNFADELGFNRFFGTRPVADVVAELRRVAGARASEPVPVTVGGASGLRVDLAGRITRPGEFGIEPGYSSRNWFLDVGGRTVWISASAPTAEFPAFLAEAERVLATVVWLD